MDALLRFLPEFKGKHRLARLLLKNDLASKKDVMVKGRYGCRYLLPNLVENVSFEIYINGIYEKASSDFIVSRLGEGAVFLDIGANIGAISIPVRKQRADCTVVCVEAAPWLNDYLGKNLELNGFGDIRKINKALYHTDNEILNFYSPSEKFGKGSLSPVYTDQAVKVCTVTVDTLLKELHLPKVDFIKVDVEGYEYAVFQGMEQLLSGKTPPDIFFEFEDWAEQAAGVTPGSAQRLLLDKGYELFTLGPNGNLEPLSGALSKGSLMLFASVKRSR